MCGHKTFGVIWLFEYPATFNFLQRWIVTRTDNPTVSYRKNVGNNTR